MQFALPIIVAVLTGVLSAVITPWVKDLADSRKARRDDKRELIREWRTGIAQAPLDRRTAALETVWYDSLRRYLSQAVRDQMEMGYPSTSIATMVPGPYGTKTVNLRRWKNDLTEAVDELAKQWGIDR